MPIVTVRVVPRSGRTLVEPHEDGSFTVRVPAPPVGGAATEQARRALAEHLGVPSSSVRLRTGARSRRKTFDVDLPGL